jgi:hypothetical protein
MDSSLVLCVSWEIDRPTRLWLDSETSPLGSRDG